MSKVNCRLFSITDEQEIEWILLTPPYNQPFQNRPQAPGTHSNLSPRRSQDEYFLRTVYQVVCERCNTFEMNGVLSHVGWLNQTQKNTKKNSWIWPLLFEGIRGGVMFWRKPPQNTVNTTIKYPCFLHQRHTSCYWYIDTVHHRCKIHPFLWLYRRLSTLFGVQMQVPLLVLCKPHREVKICHKILLILGVYDSFYS